MNTVKNNLSEIKQTIAPYTPKIIAVTKYYDKSKIIEGYNAGLRDFAESRAIESIKKINELPEEIKENSTFHFIGHLQSNKSHKVVGFFDYIHSLDSVKIAEVISQEAIRQGVKQKVLLQINNAGEEQKFGFSKDVIVQEFVKIKELKGLEIVGLMNIAPFNLQSVELSMLFKDIANLRDNLEKKYNCELKELSMGMSSDYQEAIRAGATMVRIGRKLFS